MTKISFVHYLIKPGVQKILFKFYCRSINSFILQYDWSDGGDVDIIVEDIERLGFDDERHWTDPKFNDWNMDEDEAEEFRLRFVNSNFV